MGASYALTVSIPTRPPCAHTQVHTYAHTCRYTLMHTRTYTHARMCTQRARVETDLCKEHNAHGQHSTKRRAKVRGREVSTLCLDEIATDGRHIQIHSGTQLHALERDGDHRCVCRWQNAPLPRCDPLRRFTHVNDRCRARGAGCHGVRTHAARVVWRRCEALAVRGQPSRGVVAKVLGNSWGGVCVSIHTGTRKRQ